MTYKEIENNENENVNKENIIKNNQRKGGKLGYIKGTKAEYDLAKKVKGKVINNNMNKPDVIDKDGYRYSCKQYTNNLRYGTQTYNSAIKQYGKEHQICKYLKNQNEIEANNLLEYIKNNKEIFLTNYIDKNTIKYLAVQNEDKSFSRFNMKDWKNYMLNNIEFKVKKGRKYYNIIGKYPNLKVNAITLCTGSGRRKDMLCVNFCNPIKQIEYMKERIDMLVV